MIVLTRNTYLYVKGKNDYNINNAPMDQWSDVKNGVADNTIIQIAHGWAGVVTTRLDTRPISVTDRGGQGRK